MKNIFIALSILLISACSKTEISDDKIYLFYSKNCGYCHVAIKDIAEAHPKLEIEMVDVEKNNGYDLFVACAKKHNLGNRIGTPLLCIADNYMMGWSKDSIYTFNAKAKNFIK